MDAGRDDGADSTRVVVESGPRPICLVGSAADTG